MRASTKTANVGFNRTLRKYMSMRGLGTLAWKLGRCIIVFGICFIILYPFIDKFLTSIMSPEDLLDPTVRYIPRHPSIYFFKTAFASIDFFDSLKNTLLLSLMTSILQMLVSTCVGYGFARFRYRGSGIVFALVIFTLLVPPRLILTPLFLQFRFFLGTQINLIDTAWPFLILSLTGLGIRNGLYIYMMRQFFRGFPVELEEAAYVDGLGTFRTFIHIILPNARSMMLTVFLFGFCWQWTDTVYTGSLFSELNTLTGIIFNNIVELNNDAVMVTATRYAASLIVIAPLMLIYVVAQRKFVEGIERSGLVG